MYKCFYRIHYSDHRASVCLLSTSLLLNPLRKTSVASSSVQLWIQNRYVSHGALTWAVCCVSVCAVRCHCGSQPRAGDRTWVLDLWQEDWTRPLKWKSSTACKPSLSLHAVWVFLEILRGGGQKLGLKRKLLVSLSESDFIIGTGRWRLSELSLHPVFIAQKYSAVETVQLRDKIFIGTWAKSGCQSRLSLWVWTSFSWKTNFIYLHQTEFIRIKTKKQQISISTLQHH